MLYEVNGNHTLHLVQSKHLWSCYIYAASWNVCKPYEHMLNLHQFASYLPAERTVEEMERTKQFGKEVVDLLRHQPHCRMPFSKFIPTYHHHFGRQCKLSYYGFTKLMELFEAIPDILMVS